MVKDDTLIENNDEQIEISRINSPSRSQSWINNSLFSPIQETKENAVITEMYRAAAQAFL